MQGESHGKKQIETFQKRGTMSRVIRGYGDTPTKGEITFICKENDSKSINNRDIGTCH